jgi:hypothetical protein
MPKTLYEAEKGKGEPLQSQDGVLKWAQRYRLEQGSTRRKSSIHKFLVPSSSVFRLFVDTSSSGALVKYRLLNDQLEELLSSVGSSQDVDEDGFVDAGSEVTLLHRPKGVDPARAPFTLQLEFRHTPAARAASGKDKGDACAVLDIRVVVEPRVTA